MPTELWSSSWHRLNISISGKFMNIFTITDVANDAWLCPTVTIWNVIWCIIKCAIGWHMVAQLHKSQCRKINLCRLYCMQYSVMLAQLPIWSLCMYVCVCVCMCLRGYVMSCFLLIVVVMHVSCRAGRPARNSRFMMWEFTTAVLALTAVIRVCVCMRVR